MMSVSIVAKSINKIMSTDVRINRIKRGVAWRRTWRCSLKKESVHTRKPGRLKASTFQLNWKKRRMNDIHKSKLRVPSTSRHVKWVRVAGDDAVGGSQ